MTTPDDLGLPPTAVTPTVKADIASDAAGKPRSSAETPPPPGTTLPTFWQAGATKGAIVTTIGLGLMFLSAWITGETVDKEALAAAVSAVVWAWAGALGIFKTDANALRWK